MQLDLVSMPILAFYRLIYPAPERRAAGLVSLNPHIRKACVMPDNTECGMRHSQFQTFHRSRSRMIHNGAILKKPLLKSLCTFPEIMCQPSLSGQLACTEWRSKLSG